MPLAAMLGSRLGPLVPSARARAAAGAILVSGGLGGLALLPKAEVALTVPPQILVGIGLSLVLSALTETALGGRAPQAIHGGWTISARHAGVVIGLLALTPIFTADIAQQRDDAINAGTAVILDSPVDPLLKIDLAQRIDDRLEGEKGKVPTIGPAFEPLPDDPGERAEVDAAARRTAGAAQPRRHPRLQPLLRARRPARPAGADPDRPLAEGGAVSAALRAQVLVGGAIVASLALVGIYLAAGGSSYTPEKSQDPCEHRPWTQPRRPAARSPSSSRSRPSTAPPASSGSAARRWPGRWRRRRRANASAERYGIDDAKLAKAIRAGLLRAVDDAEEAGALSPLLAGAAARHGRRNPARPGDRTGPERRSAARAAQKASSARPATCSKNSCPRRLSERDFSPQVAAGHR